MSRSDFTPGMEHVNVAFSDSEGDVTTLKQRQIDTNKSDVYGVCCASSGHVPTQTPVGEEDDNAHVKALGLEYGVDDVPPPHLCLVFGLQQVLLSISSTISIPLVVSGNICAGDMELVKSEIMSTFLVMCGTCTILQCVIGVRLPIIQGGCHKFLPAIAALMALERWQCPDLGTDGQVLNDDGSNSSLTRTDVWQMRMREIQGGIMLASLVQVFVGCTGFLGILLQFLGPITIVPTISLVGLSLTGVALNFCQKHWGITALTVGLVFLFALYMRNIRVPFPAYTRVKGCHMTRYPIFKLLPVFLAVVIAWSFCAILTVTNVFPTEGDARFARTDVKLSVVDSANWLFFPYPGQWGLPTITIASFMAMLAATITSIIESVGDYYACARISGAAQPPAHAINRGIAIEGFGSLISGAVGSGGATTSYSQNVGAIGFTKVASRAAFITAGVIFLFSGLIGKVGAVLTMMPDPVLGGIVVISFGMVTAVGLSTLSYIDLSSGRNLCIIGSSLLIGLMVPQYFSKNPQAINTGNEDLDQVLTVLLRTSMFVGGMLAFFLDNTVPGTDEERGILQWRKQADPSSANGDHTSIYDIPIITPLLRKCRCSRYVPFLPTFNFRVGSPVKYLMKKLRRNKGQMADTRQDTKL
ncbi:solute carrier family 23 member 1-like [Haliotis rufescens]|uniref:solute carrier family 23 member 1-like n=1 Tax=Haliotis rufescens TaxID=6454 RepID=UPI00201EBC5A|nr:solute carrier family 23 member 1-like [Haliotis rufescens]